MPDYKFGKLPKRADHRTLQLIDYTAALTPPPSVENGSKVKGPWEMLGNDTVGDCTCAGAGHAEMTWEAVGQGEQLRLTTAEILAAYSAITGYVPGEPSTDKGADLLTVLNYWRQTGVAGQKIGAFAEVAPHDIANVKLSIDLFGVAYVGVQLPNAVLPEDGKIKPFTIKRHWFERNTWPNPQNGHCIVYVGYDDNGPTCVTWGQTNPVSWGFHTSYCDELYAIISPDLLAAGKTPQGLDLSQLQTDLKAIAQG
jgi:hypothetical protein